jgi:hypothetical protein
MADARSDKGIALPRKHAARRETAGLLRDVPWRSACIKSFPKRKRVSKSGTYARDQNGSGLLASNWKHGRKGHWRGSFDQYKTS